ncbi:hypothetical protein [Gimesia fumaroli]|uniref:Nickel uptake substrate-specific transmembrane region n=1 Tax=Gimesia fumaroli TaxID=2527976 RepID=A0A518IFV2_9PLAN|nr:hypothetical protein [Gimesia fumaroli]QDV51963.1 hypothetical protein Enr17x_40220 [Gimesia fumaroli]
MLIGCGGEERATVYPTSGIVHYDGKPMVGGGAISFVPISTQNGKAAGGIIKDDGTFVMSTYETGDGSIAGEFRVTVYQTTVQEPETVADSDGAASETTPGPAPSEPIQTVEKKDRIPLVYSDPAKSPVTVKIDPNGKNESLNIDLKPL